MGFRAGDKNAKDEAQAGEELKTGEASSEEASEDAAPGSALRSAGRRLRDKRSIFLILAGIVVTGVAAGYSWWKKLPK